MSRFLEYAAGILDTVETTLASGHTPSDLTILVGAGGSLRLVAGASDWSLEALSAQHGASMAYRVSPPVRGRREALVEGRQGASSCRLIASAASDGARSKTHPLLRAALPPDYPILP